MDWLTDEALIAAEAAAREKAHNCPVYTGDQVLMAVRSGMRSAAAGDEWLRYRWEAQRRGLTPTPQGDEPGRRE